MNHSFTFLVFFILFSVSPVFGQGGSTKLLIGTNYVQWNTNNGSILWGDSLTFAYNDEGQPQETVELIWEDDNWTKYHRWYQREYDANNQLWRYIQQSPNADNQWEDNTRFTFTYDGQGNAISDLKESWINGEWEYLSEIKRTFDGQGKLLVYETPTTKWNYHYDQQGLNTSILCQSFVNGAWEDRWLNTLIYTPAPMSQPAENSLQRWSGVNWENHEKNVFTYTGFGAEETRVYQSWGNNAWENNTKQTRTYNSNQEINQILVQNWIGGIWENSTQINYYNELSGFLDTAVTHIWQNGNWVRDGFGRNYYTKTSPAHSPETLGFQAFPNPANTSITVKGSGLHQAKIFDLQGLLHGTHNLRGQDEVVLFLGPIPAGNYLLQVMDNSGKTGTKPLQIRR